LWGRGGNHGSLRRLVLRLRWSLVLRGRLILLWGRLRRLWSLVLLLLWGRLRSHRRLHLRPRRHGSLELGRRCHLLWGWLYRLLHGWLYRLLLHGWLLLLRSRHLHLGLCLRSLCASALVVGDEGVADLHGLLVWIHRLERLVHLVVIEQV